MANRKVLVVEPDSFVRQAMDQALSGTFDIMDAVSVADVEKALAWWKPDILLVNLETPWLLPPMWTSLLTGKPHICVVIAGPTPERQLKTRSDRWRAKGVVSTLSPASSAVTSIEAAWKIHLATT